MNATWNAASGRGSTDDCKSTRQTISCDLIPSVINHPVQIQSVGQTQIMSVGATKDTGSAFAEAWSSSIKNPVEPYSADPFAFDWDKGQQEGYVEHTNPKHELAKSLCITTADGSL